MKITIIYFASLRDKSQKSSEQFETAAKTVQELYDELNAKYSFQIDQCDLRAAVNEKYQEFSSQIYDNDTVVFIPPVAGG